MSCVRLTCVFVCLCLIYEWLLGVWTWFSVNVTHSSKHNNNQKCLCVFSLCLWTCWVFAVWMCIYFLIVMTYTHFRQVVCAFVFACGTCCAGPTAAGQKHCIELNVKTNIKHKLNNNQPPCPLCSLPHTLHTLLYNVSLGGGLWRVQGIGVVQMLVQFVLPADANSLHQLPHYRATGCWNQC